MRIPVKQRVILLVMAFSALSFQVAHTQTFPQVISYQGVLNNTDGTPVNDGDHTMLFALYPSETSTKANWTETKTVTTTDGVFSTNLGDTTPLAGSFADIRWLQVEMVFLGGNEILGPRTALTASPHAMYALEVSDGSVTNAKLGAAAVTGDKIATKAITSLNLASYSVTNAKLADGAAVETLNSLNGDLLLEGGANVSVSEVDNRIIISSSGVATGDDGDWFIDGTHLTHNTTGTVAIGTDTPMPAVGNEALLQVKSQYYPGLALDANYPSFQRWLIMQNALSSDLIFGYTQTTGTVSGLMILDDDGQVGIGYVTPTSTLQVAAGNDDLDYTDGDFQVSDSKHAFQVGVATSGANEGTVNLRAASTGGVPLMNLQVGDHTVARLTDDTLDFFGAEPYAKARFWSGDSMDEGGQLSIFGNGSTSTIELDGHNGAGGNIDVKTGSNMRCVSLEATATGGMITCRDAGGNVTVAIDGQYSDGSGRIQTQVLEITGGSDLSEQFRVSPADQSLPLEPGMVVSIDPRHPGGLRICSTAYDRKVAGVISGAGGVRPGMLMGQKGSVADGGHPVALSGRVYVQADATAGPIEPGDLLTSSGIPGLAMKVTDHDRANGAILGKAMTALPEGRGLVLVLVSLQ